MREARPEQAWEPEVVSSGNSTVSKTEQIQELVNALASNYQEVSRISYQGRATQTTTSRRDLPGGDLQMYTSWLSEAHGYFRNASLQKAALSYASEWVLDNYYIIRQALQQIEEDLPAGYYRQLPKLTAWSFERPATDLCHCPGSPLLPTAFTGSNRFADYSYPTPGTCPIDDG